MVILIRLSIHKKDLENQLMGLSFRGCVHSIVCSYCYQEQLFFDRYKWLIAKKKAIARKAEARYKKNRWILTETYRKNVQFHWNSAEY